MLSSTAWIVVAKLLTGGLQYCMFKVVIRDPCTRDDGQEERFGSNIFVTFVTWFAMEESVEAKGC